MTTLQLDAFNRFVSENLQRKPGATIAAVPLEARYREWCDQSELVYHERLSARSFWEYAAEQFGKVHTRTGKIYLDIAWLP